jgi:hypothetical protein
VDHVHEDPAVAFLHDDLVEVMQHRRLVLELALQLGEQLALEHGRLVPAVALRELAAQLSNRLAQAPDDDSHQHQREFGELGDRGLELPLVE